jgi:hypothetical protein
MPIKWKSKILLAEIEVTYGTDPTPAGADNAILATNVVLSPMEGQDVSRELELPWLAAQATIPAGLNMRLSYRVELVPSGTAGTAPAWGPLLRACACAQVIDSGVSVTYNPITDSHESLTHHMWIGGTRYVLKGCRGTATLRFDAQAIPYLEFAFTGLFTIPTESARATPDLSDFLKPDLVTDSRTPTFTIDSVSFVMRNAALDLGNDVQTRFLINSESVLIVDKAELFQCQVEALPLSGGGSWDPFTEAASQNTVAVSLVHGTTAGRIATLSIPAAQVQRPAGFANAQNILEWPLRLVPLPTSGNDQWTLALT